MKTFKYTEDGCVVDEEGFIVAEYARWQDARASARYANEQLTEGENQQTVERRLRDWSSQIDYEVMADSYSAVHYAD